MIPPLCIVENQLAQAGLTPCCIWGYQKMAGGKKTKKRKRKTNKRKGRKRVN